MGSKEIAEKLKAEGNAAFQRQDYQSAIDLFTQAIEHDPENAVLYSNRSGAHASLQRYEEALEDAELCVALDPNFVKGWSRKGLAEHNLGKSVEAIESFNEGLKRDPKNAACLQGLQAAKEKPQADIMRMQISLKIAYVISQNPKLAQHAKENPDFHSKVENIALEMVQMKNPAVLSTIFSQLGSDPFVQEAMKALFQLDLDTSAGAESKDATSEQPKESKDEQKAEEPEKHGEPELNETEKEAEALKEKGNAAYKAKKLDEAEQFYKEAIALNPQEIIYLNNLAAVHLAREEFDKCLELTQKALDMRYDVKADFAKVAKILNRRATCFLRMERYEEAIETYNKSLLEDNSRTTRMALMEAKRAHEKAQALAYQNPELAEKHREAGSDFFKKGNYPEAKMEYDEAIRRNPEDPRLYTNRAAAYIRLLEYPSALKDCEKALNLDPRNVKAWARKGACHLKLKEQHKAIDAYERGMAIDPTNEECKNGYKETLRLIHTTSREKDTDEEQMKRAMADPEIQQIVKDPQMQMYLEAMQSDPSRVAEFMKNEKIASAIHKLMAAGILKIA